MDDISNDKFGRLINNTNNITLTWEGYMWLLLPIMYIRKTIDTDLIKLFTKWYFRNLGFKTKNFNSFIYSEKFIEISNNYIKDHNYDYFSAIDKCLKDNKDDNIKDDNYFNGLKNIIYNTKKSTYLLLFI